MLFNKVYYISGKTKAGEMVNPIAFKAKQGSAAREMFYRALPGSKIEMVSKRRYEKIVLFCKWTMLVIGVTLVIAIVVFLLLYKVSTDQNL